MCAIADGDFSLKSYTAEIAKKSQWSHRSILIISYDIYDLIIVTKYTTDDRIKRYYNIIILYTLRLSSAEKRRRAIWRRVCSSTDETDAQPSPTPPAPYHSSKRVRHGRGEIFNEYNSNTFFVIIRLHCLIAVVESKTV